MTNTEAGILSSFLSVSMKTRLPSKAIDKYSVGWRQILDTQLYNSLGGAGVPKIYCLISLQCHVQP